MSVLRKLLTFSKYGMVSLVEKGVNYLTVIALTYFISPGEVGNVSFFMAIYAFVFPFINMSTNGYLYVQWQVDHDNFGSSFFSSIRLNFLITAGLLILCLASISLLEGYIDFPFWVLLGIPVMGFFESVKNNFLSYAILKNRFWQYALITVSYTILLFIITFLLIAYYRAAYTSRVAATYSSVLIIFVLVVYLLKKEGLNGLVKKEYITDAFKYGILLIPHAVGVLVLDISDRFFIKKYSGEYELGIYSTAYSLASLLALVSSSFFTPWVPRLHSYLHEDTELSKWTIVKTHARFIFAMLLASLVVYIVAFISLKYMFKPVYAVSLRYLPIIIASYFLQGIYLCFAGVLFYFKKNLFFMIASLINILLNTTLNYTLIPEYGAMGAAVSTLISMFVFSFIIAYFSNRIYPLPWHKIFKR